ncbi:hypothetical protein DLAC_11743 [Tieghemostelium lacteum]|uniref:Uncharacterized protein n=1 Tax=Tieghemostelium lacteum TaxID=361077 RepID=A0A151Z834_TIELA|nr:hypothetical protein DLAC_11743 [Tieghemostelium lacteum]|eukprot:KYQ90133.1 hypothetical protein DLAC_11743 [Tieghemostelium lacteum]
MVNLTDSNYKPSPRFIISTDLSNVSNLAASASCPPPKISGIKDNINYCLDPCTIDQKFNILKLICQPVSCLEKYKTGKIFYDVNTGLCTNVIKCDEGYILEKNECIKNFTEESSFQECNNNCNFGSIEYQTNPPINPGTVKKDSVSAEASSKISRTIFAVILIIVILLFLYGFKRCCFPNVSIFKYVVKFFKFIRGTKSNHKEQTHSEIFENDNVNHQNINKTFIDINQPSRSNKPYFHPNNLRRFADKQSNVGQRNTNYNEGSSSGVNLLSLQKSVVQNKQE